MDGNGFDTATVKFQMIGRSGSEQVFNTVIREGVTPPEYCILEEIHGRTNVSVVEETGAATEHDEFVSPSKNKKAKQKMRLRTHDEELDRLRSWYGVKLFQNVYAEKYPKLPYTFAEARIHTSIPDNVTEITHRQSQEERVAQLQNSLPESKAEKPAASSPPPKTETKGSQKKAADTNKGN